MLYRILLLPFPFAVPSNLIIPFYLLRVTFCVVGVDTNQPTNQPSNHYCCLSPLCYCWRGHFWMGDCKFVLLIDFTWYFWIFQYLLQSTAAAAAHGCCWSWSYIQYCFVGVVCSPLYYNNAMQMMQRQKGDPKLTQQFSTWKKTWKPQVFRNFI